MAKRKPSKRKPSRPTNAVSRLLYDAKREKGVSVSWIQFQIYERFGVQRSASAVNGLLRGKQGNRSHVYRGLRMPKDTGQPLAFMVADVLGVPVRRIYEARMDDELLNHATLIKELEARGKTGTEYFQKSALYQGKRIA